MSVACAICVVCSSVEHTCFTLTFSVLLLDSVVIMLPFVLWWVLFFLLCFVLCVALLRRCAGGWFGGDSVPGAAAVLWHNVAL